MPRVAVIIPFYQKQPGLLLRAVRSALLQSGCTLDIIVVDDGSPISAGDELAALSSTDLACIKILRQDNGGPGAARNRGLLEVAAATDFVAFLDSDDEWRPAHLGRAMHAFDLGADFYFTDYTPLHSGGAAAAFAWSGLVATDHTHQPHGDGYYTFGGNLFDAILRRSPIGTSTVVFRWAIGSGHLFPVSYSYGEDAAFWLLLTQGGRHVMFSTQAEVTYGKGINVAAAATWGSPSILPKLYGEYLFHLEIARRYRLNREQAAWSEAYRREIAGSYDRSLLHLLRRAARIDWTCVLRFYLLRLGRAAIRPDRAAVSSVGRPHDE